MLRKILSLSAAIACAFIAGGFHAYVEQAAAQQAKPVKFEMAVTDQDNPMV